MTEPAESKTPVKVVIAVCLDANTNNSKLSSTIKSLQEGLCVPTEIIAASNSVLSNAARKKLTVVKLDEEYTHLAKTKLASLAAVYQKYREESEPVHIFMVEPGVIYPKHFVSELITAAPLLMKNMQEQITKQHDEQKRLGDPPKVNGAVYGVCGTVMTCDRKKAYDEELQWLQEGKDVNVVKFQKNAAGRVTTTSTVEILDLAGAVYLNSKDLDLGELLTGLSRVYQKLHSVPDAEELSPEVLLANQLDTLKIQRIQVANLALNQFYMAKSGALGGYAEFDRSPSYTATLSALEGAKELNICKPVAS